MKRKIFLLMAISVLSFSLLGCSKEVENECPPEGCGVELPEDDYCGGCGYCADDIVTLETNGNELIMKSSSVEIGRVEEKMTIHKDNDEDIRIAFSAKFMMEALKSFNGDMVEVSFVGEVKPIILRSGEDEGLTQLVLPIRS